MPQVIESPVFLIEAPVPQIEDWTIAWPMIEVWFTDEDEARKIDIYAFDKWICATDQNWKEGSKIDYQMSFDEYSKMPEFMNESINDYLNQTI